MATALRQIASWACIVPPGTAEDVVVFAEPAGDKSLWLFLQQYATVPEKGRALFAGSLAEKNLRQREFRNYVRQARTYWDAGQLTAGSAAALPYYYCFLNLAKAELLTQSQDVVTGARIGHGLSFSPRGTDSIRSDQLTIQSGVFQELLRKRGVPLSTGKRLSVINLLSTIPEIGMELAEFGASRPPSHLTLHVVASNREEYWVLLAMLDGRLDDREPLSRQLARHFDVVDTASFQNWRDVFAMSRRALPGTLRLLQSKRVFRVSDAGGGRDGAFVNAANLLRQTMGPHLSDPIGFNCDAILSHSVLKSQTYTLPLGLARYATLFYLSSMVRYKPSALDPARNGAQAWLLDSFAREVPLNLLADAFTGITGAPVAFEPNAYRV